MHLPTFRPEPDGVYARVLYEVLSGLREEDADLPGAIRWLELAWTNSASIQTAARILALRHRPSLDQAAQATVDRFRSTHETKSRRPGLCHRLTKRVICGLRRIEPSNHSPSFTGDARLIRPPRGGSSSRLTPPSGACELEKTRPGSLHKAPGWGSRSHSPKRAKGAEPQPPLSQPPSSWSHRNARQPLGEVIQSLSDRRWSAGGSHGRRHGRRRCRRDGTGPSSLHMRRRCSRDTRRARRRLSVRRGARSGAGRFHRDE
jgi:hypothetical protein